MEGITTGDLSGFPIGAELTDGAGRRWIIVGVHAKYLGLKRSTWWRRLWCRIRRLFNA